MLGKKPRHPAPASRLLWADWFVGDTTLLVTKVPTQKLRRIPCPLNIDGISSFLGAIIRQGRQEDRPLHPARRHWVQPHADCDKPRFDWRVQYQGLALIPTYRLRYTFRIYCLGAGYLKPQFFLYLDLITKAWRARSARLYVANLWSAWRHTECLM